uniref:CCAAT-binding factor domain-containing protein n=1 Tax=Lygus hesperus TaxID=30085 RepID=A0A0A9WPU5_LYGHE
MSLYNTYLPNYIVAAFIKRLARMAVWSTPSNTLLIVALIFNLLRQHVVVAHLVDTNVVVKRNEIVSSRYRDGADIQRNTEQVLQKLATTLKVTQETDDDDVKSTDQDTIVPTVQTWSSNGSDSSSAQDGDKDQSTTVDDDV